MTGIAAAGSGIGTFVFAPLTEWLLEHYLWRGTLIITAGLLFNIVVCGALYRPLPTKAHNRRLVENGGNDCHTPIGAQKRSRYSTLTSSVDDTDSRSRSYTNVSYSPARTTISEVDCLQPKLQLGGSRSHPELEIISNSRPVLDVDDDEDDSGLDLTRSRAPSISVVNPAINKVSPAANLT